MFKQRGISTLALVLIIILVLLLVGAFPPIYTAYPFSLSGVILIALVVLIVLIFNRKL